MPAFDLRTEAKTSGNRPYIPGKFKNLVRLAYVVIAINLVALASYIAWGTALGWKKQVKDKELAGVEAQIKEQDELLWLANWHNKCVPFQKVLYEFFQNLPEEVRLSSLSVKHNPKLNELLLSVAINSDKNTSAQYFRKITTFLQTKNITILSINQKTTYGATVFNARLRMMKQAKDLAKDFKVRSKQNKGAQ